MELRLPQDELRINENIKYTGNWLINATYNKNDLITYYGRFLIVKNDNTSGRTPNVEVASDSYYVNMSFHAVQLPAKVTTAEIWLEGSSSPGTTSNDSLYKNSNIRVKNNNLYDSRGLLSQEIYKPLAQNVIDFSISADYFGGVADAYIEIGTMKTFAIVAKAAEEDMGNYSIAVGNLPGENISLSPNGGINYMRLKCVPGGGQGAFGWEIVHNSNWNDIGNPEGSMPVNIYLNGYQFSVYEVTLL